jgi:hypothetical protein
MRQQIKLNDNPIWRHAAYILSQYDGLLEGYNQAAANESEHEIKVRFYECAFASNQHDFVCLFDFEVEKSNET